MILPLKCQVNGKVLVILMDELEEIVVPMDGGTPMKFHLLRAPFVGLSLSRAVVPQLLLSRENTSSTSSKEHLLANLHAFNSPRKAPPHRAFSCEELFLLFVPSIGL